MPCFDGACRDHILCHCALFSRGHGFMNQHLGCSQQIVVAGAYKITGYKIKGHGFARFMLISCFGRSAMPRTLCSLPPKPTLASPQSTSTARAHVFAPHLHCSTVSSHGIFPEPPVAAIIVRLLKFLSRLLYCNLEFWGANNQSSLSLLPFQPLPAWIPHK